MNDGGVATQVHLPPVLYASLVRLNFDNLVVARVDTARAEPWAGAGVGTRVGTRVGKRTGRVAGRAVSGWDFRWSCRLYGTLDGDGDGD